MYSELVLTEQREPLIMNMSLDVFYFGGESIGDESAKKMLSPLFSVHTARYTVYYTFDNNVHKSRLVWIGSDQ